MKCRKQCKKDPTYCCKSSNQFSLSARLNHFLIEVLWRLVPALSLEQDGMVSRWVKHLETDPNKRLREILREREIILKEQHTGDHIGKYLRWVRGPPWNATSMVGLHHSADFSCGEIKHALFLHFGWEWTRNGGIWGWVGSAQNSIRRKFIFSQNNSDTISLSLKPRARAGNVNW